MAKYIVKRVIMALITILVVACVTFVLMMSVPGSPFNDEKITPEQKAAMEAKYGMDDPLGVQMLRYLKGVIVDQDFGVSLKMQKDRPVLDIITEKFPLSAKIGVIALVWAVAVGIPLGCLAAYNRGKWVDSVLRVVCTLGVSMPGFVVATFLLMLFCNDGAPFKFMGINVIFDASQGAKAYLMPCLALGLYPMCYIARLTRSSMLDALGQDYIKTARAKGLLTPRIIFSTPCAMVSSPSSPTWAPSPPSPWWAASWWRPSTPFPAWAAIWCSPCRTATTSSSWAPPSSWRPWWSS